MRDQFSGALKLKVTASATGQTTTFESFNSITSLDTVEIARIELHGAHTEIFGPLGLTQLQHHIRFVGECFRIAGAHFQNFVIDGDLAMYRMLLCRAQPE